MAEGRRLFFALWPEAALRAAMTEAAFAVARQRDLGGREIPPERVHLTLVFLGNVNRRTEEVLVAGAGRLAAPPFDLTLDQVGCFFRSRVFWLGASTTPRKMTGLWEGLRGVAAGAGVRVEPRPLAPHVTCLREIRHVIRPVPVTPIVWRVRDFALVHSVPGSKPEYQVVQRWPCANLPGPPPPAAG